MTPIQKVGQALRDHGCRGRGGMWTCPCHEDKTPSLSVSEGGQGQALLFCHAGCETPTIVSTIKLTMADLFPEGLSANGHGPPVKVRAAHVATYDYVDETGELLYQVLRYDPKGFNQRRPNGKGGWIWKLGDVRLVLYRLPAVIAAAAAGETIYVCAGEKDCEAVEAAGGIATCNSGGEGRGKWTVEHSRFLRGARVIVIAHRDTSGRAHAAAVVESLAGIAESVEVVEAAEGNDAYDHIAAGHGLEEFVAPDRADQDDQHLELDVDAFWTARPELAHVRTFARARMASPWAVLGVVLVRIIAATPYTVKLPPIIGSHASLNLAVGLVGRSGDGKGAAEGAAEDAVPLGEGMARRFDSHKLGSGQGLAHGYMHRDKAEVVRHADSCLFTMHEVDHMVGLTRQVGSTLLPELRSALMGEQLGHLYADPAKRLEVPAHSYRLALTIGIQPARAGVLLDDSDGGTPQRLIWMPTTDPDAPTVEPVEPAPLAWEPPHWPDVLPVCDVAREAIIENRRRQNHGEGDPLEGHRLLLREKLAAALDILSGRAEVSAEAWELAGTLLAVSDRARSMCVRTLAERARESNVARAAAEGERAVVIEDHVAEAAVRRVCSNIMGALEGGEWKAHALLRKGQASRDRGHFDAAIAGLVTTGQVVAEATGQGTRYCRS